MDKFEKQPDEVLDVDFDYTNWLAARTGVSPVSYAVTTPTGMTKVGDSRTSGIVKVLVGGGTDGQEYKWTCKLTTDTGLVREADCIIRVRAR